MQESGIVVNSNHFVSQLLHSNQNAAGPARRQEHQMLCSLNQEKVKKCLES